MKLSSSRRAAQRPPVCTKAKRTTNDLFPFHTLSSLFRFAFGLRLVCVCVSFYSLVFLFQGQSLRRTSLSRAVRTRHAGQVQDEVGLSPPLSLARLGSAAPQLPVHMLQLGCRATAARPLVPVSRHLFRRRLGPLLPAPACSCPPRPRHFFFQ